MNVPRLQDALKGCRDKPQLPSNFPIAMKYDTIIIYYTIRYDKRCDT